MNDCLARLNEHLIEHCHTDGSAWLRDSLMQLKKASPDELDELLPRLLARARRKVGTQRCSYESENGCIVIELPELGQVELDLSEWEVADVARVALLIQAQLLVPAVDQCALVERCYRMGDERERGAIMRGLMLFQYRENLKPLALMAARINSLLLFATIAHSNLYPAMYYSDYEFNQLVLKALFNGAGVSSITGLKQRANRELSAMCEDYIDERRDADRAIPADIWLALMPYASERAEGMVLAALESEDSAQRYYAYEALAAVAGDRPEFKPLLESMAVSENTKEMTPEFSQALKR